MNDNINKKEVKVCSVEGCNGRYYAKNYCSSHYHKYVRKGNCSVSGCGGKGYIKGYCTKHYQRYKKHGNPLHVEKDYDVPESCTIEGCINKYYSSGYCRKHYMRYYRHGSPYVLKAEPNTNSKVCSIKNCKEPHFGKGYCKNHYYKSDYHKQKSQKRRANKLSAPFNDFNENMMPEIINHFDGKCAYCGKKLKKYHIEHVIPLTLGGSHTKTNIIPACPGCNLSKKTKLLEEWYPKQPFYDRKREEKILKWMGYTVKNNKIQLQLF